jgi:hypothetical protein
MIHGRTIYPHDDFHINFARPHERLPCVSGANHKEWMLAVSWRILVHCDANLPW